MNITTVPAAIKKTQLRIAVSALFFFAGLSFASWASRIPTIQQSMHLSYAAWGAVLFALPVGLMCSLPFSGWIITKIGSKKLAFGAQFIYSFILIGIGFAQTPLQLVICLVCFGFSGNAANIAVNTQAVTAEKMFGKPIMASFHGLWSLGGFAGAGIGILMIANKITPFYHFLLIAIIFIIGLFVTARYLYDDTGPVENSVEQALTLLQKLKLAAPLLPLGVIALCSMICEGTMFDWSGIYFKKVVAAPIALQGLGFTSFMLTMFLGRFFADGFAHRFGLKRTLQVSGALTGTGLLIAVIFPYFYTALLGFLFVGAGVCSVVPMVYGAAGKSKTMSTGVALTVVSTIGFVGFLVGPPLIGFIAGLATLRASFALIAVMGISILIVSTKTNLDS